MTVSHYFRQLDVHHSLTFTVCDVGGNSTVEGAHDHTVQLTVTAADQTAGDEPCTGPAERTGIYTCTRHSIGPYKSVGYGY